MEEAAHHQPTTDNNNTTNPPPPTPKTQITNPTKQAGAQMAGVHASFGVPVVQGTTVFVLVFYSARRGSGDGGGGAGHHPPHPYPHMQQNRPAIAPETLDYIRRATAAWRIETTFSPTSTSLSTFVSTPPLGGAAGGGGGRRG